ncbi:acyl-CoA dehydrogenase family protein [Halovulum sp. GXIMD14793]
MDFDLTDDQTMVQDSLTKLLRETYDWEARARHAYDAPYHNPAAWATMAEMGLPAMLIPEAAGGYGGSGFDIATVFEPLGHALSVEPLLGVAMIGAVLSGDDPLAEGIATGAIKVAPAFWQAEDTADTVVVDNKMQGRKSVVPQGGIADQFLVTASENGTPGLYVVSATEAEVTAYGTIDGGGAAEVIFADTPCRRIGTADDIAKAEAAALLALSAEAVGVMSALRDMTLEYLKTRKQFGQTLSSFQALQHRMVDMEIDLEMTRSIVIRAAASLGTDQQQRHCSMAKNMVGRAGQHIAEEAIQLHGGIAMTWEAAVSHYAKRLTMTDAQFGDRDDHLTRLMQFA